MSKNETFFDGLLCAAPTSILTVGTIFWFYFPSSSLSKVFQDFIVLSLSYSG